MRGRYTLLYIIGVAVVLLAACDTSTVYFHYERTSLSGWERNDTVIFAVPSVQQDGHYQEEVALCVGNNFPFRSVSLVIEQTLLPSGRSWRDTLSCELADEIGNATGGGVGRYQYCFPLRNLQLSQGDSLHIRLRHDMKREILPGFSDVGFRLTRVKP